jgi:hypothetical protein
VPTASRPLALTTPEGIYSSLAVAVVCLAWSGDDARDLALEIFVYSLALWCFHIYARVVHGGWEARSWASLRHWAIHEWPHLEAALPALIAVSIGWFARLDPVAISDVAMWVTIANLLAWQVVILRPAGRGAGALAITLGVNTVVLAALIALRLQVK